MKTVKRIAFLLILISCVSVCFAETSIDEFLKSYNLEMKEIPETNFKMLSTEVSQLLFESIMGENHSYFKGKNLPVDSASWYDAIYFCNVLSNKLGLDPVYAVNGTDDVTKWNYEPLRGKAIKGEISQDTELSGFRLPTVNEWFYSALGGEKTDFSGSDSADAVAWHYQNSNYKTHEIAQKKPNKFGLYDMSGNLAEWAWEAPNNDPKQTRHIVCGGCWAMYADDMKVHMMHYYPTKSRERFIGFRFICKTKENQIKSA